MVSEVTELVAKYRIEEVAMLDSNLPVDWRRAREIARGFLDSKIKFRWTFQASTDFLCRMSDDDVRLLGDSGVSHMGFGTESTSSSVLKLMNKRHQRVDEMYETARKAAIGGIHVTFNLIFGYPGETEADRVETLRTMSDIARQFWNVSFSPNIFTPYPGIPIWPATARNGFARAAVDGRVGRTSAGPQHASVAAGHGTGKARAHAGFLSAQQPTSQSHKRSSTIAHRTPPRTGRAAALAAAFEPIFVSVGTVGGPQAGKNCHAEIACDRATSGSARSRRMLMRANCNGPF